MFSLFREWDVTGLFWAACYCEGSVAEPRLEIIDWRFRDLGHAELPHLRHLGLLERIR